MWRWLSTPAEPRGRYALYVGVMVFGLMTITSGLWQGHGLLGAALAGGLSGLIAGVVVKYLMERRA